MSYDHESDDSSVQEDAEELLEEWNKKNKYGLRESHFQKENTRLNQNYDGFLLPAARGSNQTRHHYVGSLLTCLRLMSAAREDYKAALAISLLLRAEPASKIDPKTHIITKSSYERTAEVLMTGYQLLRRHPQYTNVSQMKRYLRNAAHYQLTKAGKAEVILELVRFLIEKSNLTEAYDILASMEKLQSPSNDPFDPYAALAFEQAKLKADIRHAQWEQAMQDGSSAATQQQLQQAQHHVWNPLNISRSQWNRAGKTATELCQEAEGQYTEALKYQPHSLDAAMSLVKLHFAQNKHRAALESAEKHADELTNSIDPSAFVAAIIAGSESLTNDISQDVAEKLALHLGRVLTVNPHCSHAASVLIKLGELQVPIAAADKLLPGLLAFLDTSPPAAMDTAPLFGRGWNLLLDTCILEMKNVIKSYEIMHREHDKMQLAMQFATTSSGNSSENEMNTAANDFQAAFVAFQQNLGTWNGICNLLSTREWWLTSNLAIPHTGPHMQTALASSKTDSKKLASAAALRSFVLAAVATNLEASAVLKRYLDADAATWLQDIEHQVQSLTVIVKQFSE